MSVFRYIDTEELEVRFSQILLNSNAAATDADTLDIGFTGAYADTSTLMYAGFFRDASDGIFKIFDSLEDAPTAAGVVNVAGTGYTRASLDVYTLHAFNNVTVDNDITAGGDLTVTGDMTINGTVSTFNVNTLTVEDNIIVANAGPANTKEDAGFVVRRTPTQVVAADTPKLATVAIDVNYVSGTSIDIDYATGTVADYFKGWIITNSADGTAQPRLILASTHSAGIHTLTLETGFPSGLTAGSDTVDLFNKQYVGSIWDESTDILTFYGFPREDTMAVIDPAGDAGDGNLADYIDTRARDAYISRDAHITRDLYIDGVIKASLRVDDNIMAVNAGPTNSEDSGYVVQRTATRVAAADTAKLATVAVQAAYVSGTTLLITNAATGTDYFKGWVITNSVDGISVARTIVSSTEVATTHTLILDDGFPSGLTDGVDTVNLYNKRFVGTIYDESTDTYMTVGFPREVGEAVIDPVAPVNGNIPDYVNVAVNDISVNGAITYPNGNVLRTVTLTTGATLTATQVLQNDIIYFDPASAATFTMPTISSMNFAANRSKITMFVNLSAFKVTIAGNGGETLEGLASLVLTKVYSKTVLTGSSELATVWTIKG